MANNKKVTSTIDQETWASIKRNDIPTEVSGLMRNAYLQYSVSANIGRAIPDVRDGLKPGARRILYAMLRGHFGSSGGTNKSAKVVGLVIGNYHPHGDTAVYDTMVRMAQDFSLRVPLIYGHGNFGSMDGDPAAAYRYTECKMNKSAEALLADLDMNTVDMRDTFDAKEQEPVVLPAAFPNLLVNGSKGIGVGMATNIPPHNLGEAINAAIAVIDNPNITVDELMEIIPGPDYPTGGVIHGTAGIRNLYATGQGSMRVRGKVEIETDKSGRESIVITEIPYGINKADMVARIGEMARDGVVHGIASVNDYSSSRVGVRIVIELKQDATTGVVINELYRMTPLESNDSCQMLVIDHNRPRTMTLKQVLDAYIDHREEVIRRRTKFELDKAQARAHIIDGLLIAQANIDEVIAIIRASKDRVNAQAQLMAKFGLDEVQSNAILDMRLAQLTNLAVDELKNERAELEAEITRLQTILSSRANVMAVVREELVALRESKDFAKFIPRKTRIEAAGNDQNLDGLTKREIYVVTLTTKGYIKRCSAEVYKAQHHGGFGVKGSAAKKEGDTVQMVFSTRSHNSLLFITNGGRIYRLDRAYSLPEADRAAAGRHIANVLAFQGQQDGTNEEVRAVIPYDEKDTDFENTYIVMVTKNGLIKRCKLELFKNLRKVGKRALSFRDDDDLIDAQLTDGTKDILISSRNGRAVRFRESDVRAMGTTAAGVRAIKLKSEINGTPDSVVSMTVAEPGDDLLVITAGGYGKRTPIGMGFAGDAPAAPVDAPETETPEVAESVEAADEPEDAAAEEKSAFRYRLTKRGTQGCISIKLAPKDYVVAALQVSPDEMKDILMLTVQGQCVRTPVKEIRKCGRVTKGVIAMKFSKPNDSIVNVSLVDELSEEDAMLNAAKVESEEQAAASEAEFAERQAEQETVAQAAENVEPEVNEEESNNEIQ